jgi:CBS domain-containing protein
MKSFGIEFKHKDFLLNTSVDHVMEEKEKKNLISFTTSTSLDQAIKILDQNKILSAPVFDSESKQMIALVDILDIVTFVTLGSENKEPNILTQLCESKISDLIEQVWSTKDIYVVPHSESLLKVLESFVKFKKHRALAVDPHKKEIVLVSETDLTKFLLKHAQEIGPILQQRIEDLNLVNPLGKSVHFISVNESALAAFQKMKQQNVHALAILNEDGKLVGNISASDLRNIDVEKLAHVNKSVVQFLESIGRKWVPVTGKPRTLLEEAMSIATVAEVHRIWVTNEQEKPLGVLTLSDLFQPLTSP